MLLLTRLVVAEAVEPNKETLLVPGAENKSQQPSKKKRKVYCMLNMSHLTRVIVTLGFRSVSFQGSTKQQRSVRATLSRFPIIPSHA